MTEGEAKKTRCCGPDGCGEYQNISGRIGLTDAERLLMPRLCIGPACMAWRWAAAAYEYTETDNRVVDDAHARKTGYRWLAGGGDAPPPAPPGNGWEPVGEPTPKENMASPTLAQLWRRPHTHRVGYCGLAGQP